MFYIFLVSLKISKNKQKSGFDCWIIEHPNNDKI